MSWVAADRAPLAQRGGRYGDAAASMRVRVCPHQALITRWQAHQSRAVINRVRAERMHAPSPSLRADAPGAHHLCRLSSCACPSGVHISTALLNRSCRRQTALRCDGRPTRPRHPPPSLCGQRLRGDVIARPDKRLSDLSPYSRPRLRTASRLVQYSVRSEPISLGSEGMST
jgi:hypothetical protein